MDDIRDPDAMVVVAALVSRVEALVVASMLEAGGVDVTVDGDQHAAVAVCSLALGGHRLRVPASQHVAASALIYEVLGEDEWGFSHGLQRAVLKISALWVFPTLLYALVGFMEGSTPFWAVLTSPLQALTLPVNPQGRGDYYLVAAAD